MVNGTQQRDGLEGEAVTSAPAFSTPYLGRTVRIVGPVANVDPKQLPHPMNQRGELARRSTTGATTQSLKTPWAGLTSRITPPIATTC